MFSSTTLQFQRTPGSEPRVDPSQAPQTQYASGPVAYTSNPGPAQPSLADAAGPGLPEAGAWHVPLTVVDVGLFYVLRRFFALLCCLCIRWSQVNENSTRKKSVIGVRSRSV